MLEEFLQKHFQVIVSKQPRSRALELEQEQWLEDELLFPEEGKRFLELGVCGEPIDHLDSSFLATTLNLMLEEYREPIFLTLDLVVETQCHDRVVAEYLMNASFQLACACDC